MAVVARRVWSEYLRNCRLPGNWDHHYHLLGLQRIVPKSHQVFINRQKFNLCWSTSWMSRLLHSLLALSFPAFSSGSVICLKWRLNATLSWRPPLIYCHRFRAREGGPFTFAFERGLTFHIQEQGRKPVFLQRGSIHEVVVGLINQVHLESSCWDSLFERVVPI